VLEHYVLARIRNEDTVSLLMCVRKEAPLQVIAAVTSVEKIEIFSRELREVPLRAIVINAECFIPLYAVQSAAVDTLRGELNL
jgi:hypothetical protein